MANRVAAFLLACAVDTPVFPFFVSATMAPHRFAHTAVGVGAEDPSWSGLPWKYGDSGRSCGMHPGFPAGATPGAHWDHAIGAAKRVAIRAETDSFIVFLRVEYLLFLSDLVGLETKPKYQTRGRK